jgi:hypothetical protein
MNFKCQVCGEEFPADPDTMIEVQYITVGEEDYLKGAPEGSIDLPKDKFEIEDNILDEGTTGFCMCKNCQIKQGVIS